VERQTFLEKNATIIGRTWTAEDHAELVEHLRVIDATWEGVVEQRERERSRAVERFASLATRAKAVMG
jgi:hypothetical protein